MTAGQISEILAWAMIAIWAGFIVLFLARHPRAAAVAEIKRAERWWVGLLIQAAAFGMIWVLHREFGTAISGMPIQLELALAMSAIGIGLFSAWLALGAMRELGKQWAIAPRIISGHELVTSGPFRIVRHPIYTGLLGLLIATALAFTTWFGLIISVALYIGGTTMRIRAEERLLRDTFGPDYDAYASEVPALVPGLF